MQSATTWVLVARQGCARLFEAGVGKAPRPLILRRQLTGGVGPGDGERQDGPGFARDLGALLERACRAGSFSRLVLVAPPQVLSDLRAALDAQVRKLVVAEVDKDLSQLSPNELPGHLAAVV